MKLSKFSEEPALLLLAKTKAEPRGGSPCRCYSQVRIAWEGTIFNSGLQHNNFPPGAVGILNPSLYCTCAPNICTEYPQGRLHTVMNWFWQKYWKAFYVMRLWMGKSCSREAGVNVLGSPPYHTPNQTKWKHVQTHD